MPNSASAVVVGAELNGLGVLRSLARGDVPATVVGTTRKRAAMCSRFGRAFVLDQIHGKCLVDGLLQLKAELGHRPVLILTDALAVNTVSEYRNALIGAYRFHLPPRHVVAMLQNKARFYEFAEQNELPVPRAILLKRNTPLAMLAALAFPVVVKSAKPRATDFGGPKNLEIATSLPDAENICRQMLQSTDELVVQEWIDGPDSNTCFALFYLGHKPSNFQIFAGRKLASYPAKFGSTALCLPATEVLDALAPQIAKFLGLTDFRGLGRLEFKWDIQQRRYIIIGVATAHTSCQEEIATLSGVNFALAAYRDELDLPPLASTAIDCAVAWRQSALLRGDLPMLSPGTCVYDGYWRLDDPMPALFAYGQFGLKSALRCLNPILGKAKLTDFLAATKRAYQTLRKAIFRPRKVNAWLRPSASRQASEVRPVHFIDIAETERSR